MQTFPKRVEYPPVEDFFNDLLIKDINQIDKKRKNKKRIFILWLRKRWEYLTGIYPVKKLVK